MSSESTDGTHVPAPGGEVAALIAVQGALADRPQVMSAARGLSHFGEHSLGWLAISGVGWTVARVRGDAAAERKWLQAGVGAFGAHAASVVIKRVVRRRRPHDPRIRVGVSTPSQLSFPSSHATSTTAAAILIGRAAGPRGAVIAVPAAVVPPMLLSRLVLGVHYPSDVAAGAAIGAASAAAVAVGDKVLLDVVRRRADRAGRRGRLRTLAGAGAAAATPAPLRLLGSIVARVTRNREKA